MPRKTAAQRKAEEAEKAAEARRAGPDDPLHKHPAPEPEPEKAQAPEPEPEKAQTPDETPHITIFKLSLPEGGTQAIPQIGGGLTDLEAETLLELGIAAVRAQLGLPKR